jgi:hypothetical protein
MADYDLKIALQKMGTKRMNFALYRGSDSNQVLLTPRAPAPKLIKETETECGDGKRVLKGIAFYEGNDLIFATRKPAPQWEKQITLVFKDRKCATFLPIALRELAEDESDEVIEESETPEGEAPEGKKEEEPGSTGTPPVTEDLSASWLALKNELTPQIKAAAAGTAANKGQVLGLVRTALEKEKAHDLAGAIAAFEQVKTILAGGTVPPSTPTGTPETSKSGVPQPEATKTEGVKTDGVKPGAPPKVATALDALMASMKKLIPIINKTIADHPDAKPGIAQAVATFYNHHKAGDVDNAKAGLIELANLLKQAAAGSPTIAPTSEVKPESGTGDPETEWTKLFASVEGRYLEATKIDGQTSPEAADIIRRIKFQWSQATDLAGDGQYDKAMEKLRQLEKDGLFDQALTAKAQGGEIGGDRVAKLKFLVTRWQRIPGELAAELDKLKAQIDGQLPGEDGAELTDAIGEYLNELVEEIQDEIDDAINEGDFKAMAGLKNRVTSDPLMNHLLGNPFFTGTKFQSVVLDAIAEVEAKLAA